VEECFIGGGRGGSRSVFLSTAAALLRQPPPRVHERLEPIRIFADRLKSLDGRTDIRDVDLNARFGISRRNSGRSLT